MVIYNNTNTIIDIPMLRRPPEWNSSLEKPEKKLEDMKNWGCIEEDYIFCDYNKCDKLSELVSGKRVAIVGPSGHLSGLGNGNLIDSYDIVIRINHLPSNTAEYRLDYGTKTDILADGLNIHGWKRFDDNDEYIKSMKYIIVPQAWDSPPNDIERWQERLDKFGVPNNRISSGYFYKICKEVGTLINTGFSTIMMMMNYDVKELYITGISFYNMAFSTKDQAYYSKDRNTNDLRHDLHKQLPQIEYFKKMIRHHYMGKLSLDNYLSNSFSEVIKNVEQEDTLRKEMREKGYVVLRDVFSKDECVKYKKIIKNYFDNNPDKTLFNNCAKPDAFGDRQLEHLQNIFYNQKFTEPLHILSSKKLMFLHHSDIHYNFDAYSFHDDNQARHLSEVPKEYSFIEEDLGEGKTPYECYTIAIYMQDHTNGSGLTVIEGTHLEQRFSNEELSETSNRDSVVDISSNAGDVIIFDARLYHRGNVLDTKDRASIFLRMGCENMHGVIHAKGAIERQKRQTRKRYTITNSMMRCLEENGIRF